MQAYIKPLLTYGPKTLEEIEGRLERAGLLEEGADLREILQRQNAALEEHNVTHEQIGDRLEGILGRAIRTWQLEGRKSCLLYTSPSPRDLSTSRMPSSA